MADLRRAGPRDWEIVRALRLRALATDPDGFSATLATEQEWPATVWPERLAADQPTYLALDTGEAVGMAGGFALADSERAMVWGMWVAPEARGRGHGRRLLAAVVEWARSVGRTPYLHVSEGNSARLLYARDGFESTGQWFPLREGSLVRVEEMVLRRASD